MGVDFQAEGADAFSQFHLYVCSALLVKYSERLRDMDFQVSRYLMLRSFPLLTLPPPNHIYRLSLPPASYNKSHDGLRTDEQEMIIFLQCLPTNSWNDHDIELLLSEAYVLKTVWQGAENHFANLPNGQGGGFGMLGR